MGSPVVHNVNVDFGPRRTCSPCFTTACRPCDSLLPTLDWLPCEACHLLELYVHEKVLQTRLWLDTWTSRDHANLT